MRTKEFKNNLFNKNKTILEIIYYLGNGIMLSEQLIKLTNFIEPLRTNVKEDIQEMIVEGFLKEKQVLYNNKYVVYLTKYPIARIRGIESRNATSIRPSTEKILNSLYKLELLLNMLSKKTDFKYTVENVLSGLKICNNSLLINKNNSFEIYSLLEENLNEANPSNTFYQDKKTVEYDKEMRFKKDNINIDKTLKIAKEQTIKSKVALKKGSVSALKNSFNFSNMLNRGFHINKIHYKNGKMVIDLNYLDISSNDIDKIYFGIGCIYNMFKNYFKGVSSIQNSTSYLDLKIQCIINTGNLERAKILKEDCESKVPDMNGGFKEHPKGKNALIRAGVPQMYLDDIKVLYRNLDFKNKYNINLS